MEYIKNKYVTASVTATIAILALAIFALPAVMAATQQTATATVTVNQFLSVTIDDPTLAFGDMNPLATTKPTDDPLVATIGAESNVNAKVETKANAAVFDCTGAPCTPGTDTFAISYLEWDFEDSFAGTPYTETNAEVCANVAAEGTCNVYHELEIPSGQAAGPYSVGITITASV